MFSTSCDSYFSLEVALAGRPLYSIQRLIASSQSTAVFLKYYIIRFLKIYVVILFMGFILSVCNVTKLIFAFLLGEYLE